jgi:hypothetical protein
MHPTPTAKTPAPRASQRRGAGLVGIAISAALAAALAGTLVAAQPLAREANFRILVHPSNPITVVDRRFLARALLKKVTSWPNGEPIQPVDLRRDSPIRLLLTEQVLDRTPAAVRNYWQQIIFSGRGVPPPEVGSGEEVVRFVLQYPGALGYVSPKADVRGAKVLTVIY